MRADRLVATLLLMQARGSVTAAELADELEISVSTARRDLEALSAAGIPVYPQVGRGGGWQLLGGARTDLTGLSASEARALFLLVGPAASVAPEAKSALHKLVRALPETFRADAEAAADAVVIDPSRWGRSVREQPPLVAQLQAAVVQRVKVRVVYRGWDREPAERLVEPWGLVEKSQVWYLLGRTDGGRRTYRVDRIVEAVVTEETGERPADFDLAEAWAEVVREVDEQRHSASAIIVAGPIVLSFLRERFGEHAVTAEPLDGNRLRARVAAPTTELLARGLAGWGDQIDVLEPDEVRAEIGRIGAELVRRYPTGLVT
jgi:predicted DNA-binding transcriptional regulator YafY